MEMEMEIQADASPANSLVDRLEAAASLLAEAAEQIANRNPTREAELERLLAESEATIATLKSGGRKTTPAGIPTLVAKEGTALDAGALDAALVSLSLEQRIAVKAQMLRSGLLG